MVSTDRYQDAGLSQLRAPVHDAQALADVLTDPGIGGFEVRRVVNQPAHVVNMEVEHLLRTCASDDMVIVYFSCHGMKDDSGRLYFATRDTRQQLLGSTAVSSAFVKEQLEASRSRKIVVLLDCCFSGAFTKGMVARSPAHVDVVERLEGRGRAVITASTAMEYAFEFGEEQVVGSPRPSIFTSAIVQGLVTGEADRDEDGLVSVDELYDYVFDRVKAETPSQTPSKFSDVAGELYIAKSRRERSKLPPTLPAEVSSAVDHPLPSVRLGAISVLGPLVTGAEEHLRIAAYNALETLRDDDSRAVSEAARHALASLPPPHGRITSEPTTSPPRHLDTQRGLALPANGATHEEFIEPFSVLAYLMGSLAFLFFFTRKRRVRFHVLQSAGINVLSTIYLIAIGIPVMIYTSMRYGQEEIPPGDLVMNLWIGCWFALEISLRAFCIVKICRRGEARIPIISPVARTLAYGNVAARSS